MFINCINIKPSCVPLTSTSVIILIINEPQHAISNNAVCATSKGSDQPVQPC